MTHLKFQGTSNQIGIRIGNVSHTNTVKRTSLKWADYIDGRIKTRNTYGS